MPSMMLIKYSGPLLPCFGARLSCSLLLQIETWAEHIATSSTALFFLLCFFFILKKTILRENIRFPRALGFRRFCVAASLSIFHSIDAPSSILYIFDLWASFLSCFPGQSPFQVRSIKIIIGILLALMLIASANAAYEYCISFPATSGICPQAPEVDRTVQNL